MLQFTKSGSAPAKFVGQGEAAVGIVFSHDIVAEMEKGSPVELTFPAEGTGYEIGGMGIIKGAKNLPYQDILALMEICQGIGAPAVDLMAKQGE